MMSRVCVQESLQLSTTLISHVWPCAPHPQVYAVSGKSVEAANFLISRGAKVDVAANDNTTAICVAAQEGHAGQ